MTTKVVRWWTGEGEPEELARFVLRDDGTIEATYRGGDLRERCEAQGIYTAAHGRCRATDADGQRFLDCLELAYSHSSFVHVVDA